MSSKETSWILELIDQVTKPMREIVASVKQSTQVIDKNTERVIFNEKQTKTALANSKKHYKDLQTQIKENEKEVKELQKAYDAAAPGTRKLDSSKPLAISKRKLEELRKELQGAGEDIRQFESDLSKHQLKKQRWEGVMTGANQTMEVIERVGSMLNFADPISETKTEIQRMTEVSGQELNKLTAQTHKLGAVFNENDTDIARAANSMSKTWGGSFSDMLNLINSGFEKGADINDNFIKSMTEYPKQLQDAGIGASEAVALLAQANKDGVFSDKAIDSIKEANLSLKEMNKSQAESLKGIGIKASDLKGKTSFEAMQLISEKMKTASNDAQQEVLKNIFKAAGEDAAKEFVLGLSSVNLDINSLPTVKQAGAGLKGFIADIQSWTANTFGGSIKYLQAFGQASSGIVGIISLFKSLTQITALQELRIKAAAIAQRIWNTTMLANPIGVLIGGAAALGGAVYGLTQMVRDNTDVYLKSSAIKEINEELDKRAINNTVEKTAKIKTLTEVAANEKISLEARKKALNELIEIDSRYREALVDGIIKTDKLREVTAKLTTEIIENARAKAMEDVIVEKEKEMIKALNDKASNQYKGMNFFQKAGDAFDDMVYGDSEWRRGNNAEDILRKNPIQVKVLSEKIAKYYEKKAVKKEEGKEDTSVPTLDGNYEKLFNNTEKKGRKSRAYGNTEKDGLSINGTGSGGSKTINQTINITNQFTRTNNTEDRSFSDKIITQINDGLRDALVTV